MSSAKHCFNVFSLDFSGQPEKTQGLTQTSVPEPRRGRVGRPFRGGLHGPELRLALLGLDRVRRLQPGDHAVPGAPHGPATS